MPAGGFRRTWAFLIVEFVSCVVQRCPRPRQILNHGAGRNEVAQHGPQARGVVDIKADYVVAGVQINVEAVRHRADRSARPGSYLNVNAVCFVEIATLDVGRRKPFQHGPSYIQRQATLCQQTNDFDWARNLALDEREFSRVCYLGGHVFSMAKRHRLPIRSRFCPEIQPAVRASKSPSVPTIRLTGGTAGLPAVSNTHGKRLTRPAAAAMSGAGVRAGALIPPAQQN